MNDIFRLAYCNEERIVIEVIQPLSNFQLAMYPYLTKEMDFISLSKDKRHLAIVNIDGTVTNYYKNTSINYTTTLLWNKIEDLIWRKELQ